MTSFNVGSKKKAWKGTVVPQRGAGGVKGNTSGYSVVFVCLFSFVLFFLGLFKFHLEPEEIYTSTLEINLYC